MDVSYKYEQATCNLYFNYCTDEGQKMETRRYVTGDGLSLFLIASVCIIKNYLRALRREWSRVLVASTCKIDPVDQPENDRFREQCNDVILMFLMMLWISISDFRLPTKTLHQWTLYSKFLYFNSSSWLYCN